MELFVVNRHVADEPLEQPQNDQEQQKLQRTLKRIERNKKLRNKQKEKDQAVRDAIERTTKARQIKRELKLKKASFVPVPDNIEDEFLDTNIDTAEVSENKPAAVEGFTILGVDDFNKQTKVKRVLPRWLTTPTVISVNLQKLETKVKDVKVLDKQLQKLLKINGITKFFPVQAEVIPWLIESNRHSDIIFPRDICVSAPTGSGKTLAYVLPVIQVLKKYSVKKIRALVILPTRDLARQVFNAFKTYSEGTNIDVCLITGQNSFEIEQKQIVMKNDAFGFITKIDVLISTAGRLVDHLKLTEGLDLEFLEFLIIDEADRVLESIQNDWLYHLEKHIAPEGASRILNQYMLQKRRPPQKLLFSATLSQDPEKLQQLSLFQPKLFTSVVETSDEISHTEDSFIGKYTTPSELTERYIETSQDLKPLVLYKFIKQENLRKTLVFAHSVESTHRLTILLKAMFKKELVVEEISAHLQMQNRRELIKRFTEGDIDILISTDSLARGIDVPSVQCVISYSAPKYLKGYIHRVGRTARAGQQGLAVTFLHNSQISRFKTLLKQAGKHNVDEIKISEDDLEQLGEKYKDSLKKLKETVEKEERDDVKKIKSSKRSRPVLSKKPVSEM